MGLPLQGGDDGLDQSSGYFSQNHDHQKNDGYQQ